MFAAGNGVLRSRLGDGPDQEHQGQLPERGVDRLHLPGDPQGEWLRCQAIKKKKKPAYILRHSGPIIRHLTVRLRHIGGAPTLFKISVYTRVCSTVNKQQLLVATRFGSSNDFLFFSCKYSLF